MENQIRPTAVAVQAKHRPGILELSDRMTKRLEQERFFPEGILELSHDIMRKLKLTNNGFVENPTVEQQEHFAALTRLTEQVAKVMYLEVRRSRCVTRYLSDLDGLCGQIVVQTALANFQQARAAGDTEQIASTRQTVAYIAEMMRRDPEAVTPTMELMGFFELGNCPACGGVGMEEQQRWVGGCLSEKHPLD